MENQIKTRRKELGLSQEELARRCGVTRQTINAIENDKYDPTLSLAFSLAALLDFYQGTEIRDGALIGSRNGEEYPIRDDAPVLAFFAAHSHDAPEALAHAFLSNVDFFGQDLTQEPGLEAYVAQALADIRAKGMRQAMAERFPVKG